MDDTIRIKDLKGARLVGGKHLCGQVIELEFENTCGTKFTIKPIEKGFDCNGMLLVL